MLTRFPFIVKNFLTVFFKFFLFAPAVFKTMEMNFYPFCMKYFEFIKNIDRPSVIGGIGDIEGDYVKMLIQEIITLPLQIPDQR